VVLRWYNASIGSDNQLLTWFIDTSQADIPATTVDFRLWHTVDVGGFRTALMTTLLSDPDHWAGCMLSDPDHWTGCSVDDVAQLYGTVLTGLADTFAPVREVTRRPWQSDPCFNTECRSAKQLTRQLERAATAAGHRRDNAAAAAKAWHT